ncbi:MAG: DinB family protein [Candidatus Zixiibacteriota bacterium]
MIGLDRTNGFSPRIGLFWAELEAVRRGTVRYVQGLCSEQLAWSPQSDVESIGTLLLHIAAVERSWIGEDIGRRPMGEEWMAAFPIRFGIPQVVGQPLDYYVNKLDTIRAETRALLQSLSDEDLSRPITPLDPGDGADTFTVEWILHHLVEHEAHHRGQIALLKRWYRAQHA